MKDINTTYKRTKESKFVVTRTDGIIDGPDYFDSMNDVNKHIAAEIEFGNDADMDSFRTETISDYDNYQHERLDEILEKTGLKYKDIAEITGHTYDSVKMMLQPNRELPRWVNLVIYVWEQSKAAEMREK